MEARREPAPPMGAILDADTKGLVVTAVKTAMELDIFSVVAAGNTTAEAIAGATACDPRGMTVLLNALCVIDLLAKDEGAYSLTPTSDAYLVRGRPAYCTPIYLAWLQAREKFTDFVRTGRATIDLTAPAAEPVWESYVAPEALQWPELVPQAAEHWTAAGITPEALGAPRILDIGCGSGYKGFALLRADPAARITSIDSPRVLDVARRVASEMGILDRVAFVEGDVSTPLPAAAFDIVIFGNLLHYYEQDAATRILTKAFDALAPDGIVAIFGRPVDEERGRSPGLLSMIDVSNCAPLAQVYAFSEYRRMLVRAGFTGVSQPDAVIILGRKEPGIT